MAAIGGWMGGPPAYPRLGVYLYLHEPTHPVSGYQAIEVKTMLKPLQIDHYKTIT